MGSVLALIAALVDKMPAMIAAGIDIYEMYGLTKSVIDANKAPGDAEWEALDDKVKALQAQVRDTSQDVR